MNAPCGSAPVRLRLSRRKGFDLQALSLATNGLPAINVARPGKWGNLFTMQGCRDVGYRGDDAAIAARVMAAFRVWIDTPLWQNNWQGPESEQKRAAMLAAMPTLRGNNLACWCALGQPCHADVLLEIANRPICEAVR